MSFADRHLFDHPLTKAFHEVIRELDEEYGDWIQKNKK